MDITNPVIQLCMEGTRAEFEYRMEEAGLLYEQAWNARTDNYEACIAAHYVARFQESAEESLRWNQVALDHANAINDERVKDFHPSLFWLWDVLMKQWATRVKRRNIMSLLVS